MKLSDLKQVLRPIHDRPDALRFLDPIVGIFAGAALIYASALGFAAFGVLLACAFLAFQLLSKVFGVKFDFDPALFQQYARGQAN